jgi:hypothetical protein
VIVARDYIGSEYKGSPISMGLSFYRKTHMLLTLVTALASFSPLPPISYTPFPQPFNATSHIEAQVLADAQGRAEARLLEHELKKELGLPVDCSGCSVSNSPTGTISYSGNVTFLDLAQTPAVKCVYTVDYTLEILVVGTPTNTCPTACASATCTTNYEAGIFAAAVHVSGTTGEEDTAIWAANIEYKCDGAPSWIRIPNETDTTDCPLIVTTDCGGNITYVLKGKSGVAGGSTETRTSTMTCAACIVGA